MTNLQKREFVDRLKELGRQLSMAETMLRNGLTVAEDVMCEWNEREAERLYEAMNALQVKDEYHKAREAVDGLIQLLRSK